MPDTEQRTHKEEKVWEKWNKADCLQVQQNQWRLAYSPYKGTTPSPVQNKEKPAVDTNSKTYVMKAVEQGDFFTFSSCSAVVGTGPSSKALCWSFVLWIQVENNGI